jgi:hypothetical protein
MRALSIIDRESSFDTPASDILAGEYSTKSSLGVIRGSHWSIAESNSRCAWAAERHCNRAAAKSVLEAHGSARRVHGITVQAYLKL